MSSDFPLDLGEAGTGGLDDRPSARFAANLAVLEETAPAIAEQIAAMKSPISRIVGSVEEGDLNIDLGHAAFYDEDAESYSAKQVESFLEKPRRIEMPGYKTQLDTILCNQEVVNDMLVWMDERDLKPAVKPDRDGGYLIMLGLGLGLGVERLLEELPVRNLVIVERYPEFLRHSLETADWAAWRDLLESRGGSMKVILARDQYMAANELYIHVRNHHFGLIDGSYMLLHYQSSFTRGVLDELVQRLPVIAANPGFFEDELIMLRNCFRNLRRHEHKLLQDRRRLMVKTPVIVVASGPSVDTAIDFVRANRERAVIISCGTGLGALLGYGIKPDFHVDTENTPGPLEILSGLAETHDLSGVTLIACNTVDPGVPALFDERYLYFRDSVTATHYFGRDQRPLLLAAPTVSNAAVRSALTLGFREIYLVGVDLGSRDPKRHHSKKSIYMADETFLETHPDHREASKYPIRRPGSLGGTVFANASFLYASMYMANLMRVFAGTRVVNLSDGARIDGTIPKLPHVARIENEPAQKTRDLQIVANTLEAGGGYKGFDAEELRRLQRRMALFIDDLVALFREVRDPVALFDAIKDMFKALGDGPIDETIYAYLWGTSLMFYQFIYVVVRRLPEEAREAFLDEVSARSADRIAQLKGDFDALIDELVAEL
ncbi:MAG: DUF115 domain-containing protein [Marivibrio sp.]|uniref:motility associated factor glycosyltransferase family protein n=1 Tax=Marivibrio sp. TaxID=2039719 RepID=UPI0032EE47A9